MEAEESARRGTLLRLLIEKVPPRSPPKPLNLTCGFACTLRHRPLCRCMPVVLDARGELRRGTAACHRCGIPREGAGDLLGCARYGWGGRGTR